MSQFDRKITRRNFIKTTLSGIVIGMMDVSLPYAQGEYDLVVISGEPAMATKKAIDLMGGISHFVKKGQE